MPVTVIVGSQWGDEGKGKIVDYLADQYDLVGRYQGGNNAGHTVVVGEKTYKLHFIPSGVIKGKKVAIGNGCVINPDSLLEEIRNLGNLGVKNINLTISERAHVITPQHIDTDSKEGGKVGTTGRGIGPCYTDKIARKGIRMVEYIAMHPKSELKKYVDDVSLVVNEMLDEGKRVLLEGAQGTLLDIDHGTYPYVTSSNTIAGGACTGFGISPKKIDRIIGVAKAYATRVGHGPFPTELIDGTGEYIRRRGREYGTTTGRPRRCGWFDAVVVRYASRINGFDEIIITKLDVLSGLEKIKLCKSYHVNGNETREIPLFLGECQPISITLPGWEEEVGNARKKEDLPKAAVEYLDNISESLDNLPISMVGVGPERNQILEL